MQAKHSSARNSVRTLPHSAQSSRKCQLKPIGQLALLNATTQYSAEPSGSSFKRSAQPTRWLSRCHARRSMILQALMGSFPHYLSLVLTLGCLNSIHQRLLSLNVLKQSPKQWPRSGKHTQIARFERLLPPETALPQPQSLICRCSQTCSCGGRAIQGTLAHGQGPSS